MFNLKQDNRSVYDQLNALRAIIATLSGDPEQLDALNARLSDIQQMASGLPATQENVAALTRQLSQLNDSLQNVVWQDQIDGMATKESVAQIQQAVNAIHVPDVSNLATQEAVNQVSARIPDVSGLATTASVSDLRAQIPDVSGLATRQAVSDLASRIPDTSGLATQQSVNSLAARIPDTSGLASRTQLQSLSDTVSAISVPSAATATPVAVAPEGQSGTSVRYAREDHTHAARVQRKILTLDTNGQAVWTFDRPFANMPVLNYMVFQDAGNGLIIVEANEWVRGSNNTYAGVRITGRRHQRLPLLATVTGILTAVITGVNALVTALSGFDVFGGGNLNGVRVHMSAGDVM